MTVLQLHKPKATDDVVAGLRRLADQIESGEATDDRPVSTCMVLFGHTERKGLPDADGVCLQGSYWKTYGYGPRTDVFTVRGLLMSVMRQWDSGEV